MATRLLYQLGVLLLLAIAAAWTSGAAAFGLPRVSSGYCVWTSPFNTVNATAIHIGNTKSCISGYGRRLDPYTMYQFCIPSWVAFTANSTLFGEAAMNHAGVSPGTAVSGFKRLLGVSMHNEIVKKEAELVPYEFSTQLGRCGIKMETEDGGVMEILPESVRRHPNGRAEEDGGGVVGTRDHVRRRHRPRRLQRRAKESCHGSCRATWWLPCRQGRRRGGRGGCGVPPSREEG